jgi:hypothetical protein
LFAFLCAREIRIEVLKKVAVHVADADYRLLS